MTLEQLRIFVAVAEVSHVTRAAAALNLGQSAVSAAIAALEERHGVPLFTRVGRGIVLNQTGMDFLGPARAVLAEAARAEASLVTMRDGNGGTLRLMASQTIANYWLPLYLARYLAGFPGVTLRLSIGNTADVVRATAAGEVELGFSEGPVTAPSLTAETLARDQLIVLVAPRHPWAGQAPVNLSSSGWVLRERGSGTRAEFEAGLLATGRDPATVKVVLELPSNEAVRGAVEAGLGATALSASVVASSVAAGRLAVVKMHLPARRFQLLHHAGRQLGPAASHLRAQLLRG